MIQRIQSVYFFLASLALAALFMFPIATVFETGGAKKISVTGVSQTIDGNVVQTENFLLLTIITALLALNSLVLIFLYKNRKQQMIFTYIHVVVVIAYSFWLSQTVKNATIAILEIGDYGIGAGLSSIAVLFLVLAVKGIKRDDKLIKSADRLR
ncbi:DUF4293 family protein [Pedobacter aquae]|uniref:DUF4293 family protein n=1 Tax=Pedobacter aquae TaxID=2605747 RepID=A0A5C0VGZ1_9SPHI|nr:DUF4293 domain-containing protein [Pedobacter aquae]QEK50244.1 DUF4293 family protein [Pedobacter aquae]